MQGGPSEIRDATTADALPLDAQVVDASAIDASAIDASAIDASAIDASLVDVQDLALPAPVTTAITLWDVPAQWLIGTRYRPHVIALRDDASTLDVSTQVTWDLDPADILTLTPQGDLTATAVGEMNLRAHFDGFESSAPVQVDFGFDFQGGLLPSGVIATTNGDTLYRQTSSTTVEALTLGPGVAVFEDRGRGLGALTFDAYDNVIVPVYGTGWPFALSQWDRISATSPVRIANVGLAPDGTSMNADLIRDDSLSEAMGIYAGGPGSGHSVASIWLRASTQPTSSVLVSTSADGSRTDVELTPTLEWQRVHVIGAQGPLLTVRPAGLLASAVGEVEAWGASVIRGRYDLPLLDGAAAHADAATLALPVDARWIVDGGIHWRGTFQQLVFDPRDLVPAPQNDPRHVFYAETPDGPIALYARYAPTSQIEWHFVVRGTDAIVSTYAPGLAGIGIGGAELDEITWDVEYSPRQGRARLRVGFNHSFSQIDAVASGADLAAPTSFYLGSRAGVQSMAGLHREIREASQLPAPTPEFIIVGDSITDAGSRYPRPADYIYAYAETKTHPGIFTLSVHGHTTTDQIAAWQNYETPSSLKVAIVLIGWNDIVQSGANAAFTRGRIQDLIDALKARAPQMEVWLCAITPGRTSLDAYQTPAALLEQWRELNADIEGHTSFTQVDRWISRTNHDLNDGTDALVSEFDSSDGLHPNALGRRVLGSIFRSELLSAGYLP